MSWLDEVANVVKTGGKGVLDALDWSEQHGKEWAGDAMYWQARLSPGNSTDYLSRLTQHLGFAPSASEEDILAAHGRGGGRAAWEAFQNPHPRYQRGIFDIISPYDPVNALGYVTGVGPVREGIKSVGTLGRAMHTAEGAGPLQRLAGRGIANTGNLTWALVRASELPGEGVVKIVGYPLKKGAQKTKNVFGALDYSVRTLASRDKRNTRAAVSELEGNLDAAQGLLRRDNPMTGFRADDMESQYFGLSPFRVGDSMEGTMIGIAAQNKIDNSFNVLKMKMNARAKSSQAMGVISPTMGAGSPLGTVAQFSREDMPQLVDLVGSLYAGNLSDIGKAVSTSQGLAGEISQATGYHPSQIEPILPAVLKRLQEANPNIRYPDPMFTQSTGLPNRGLDLPGGRNAGNLFGPERGGNLPTSTFGVGDEAAHIGAADILGNRAPIDPNDMTNVGTGSPFAIGGELYNYDIRVEIKPSKAGKKATPYKKITTTNVRPDDLPGLQEMADQGLITLKVQGTTASPPQKFRDLLTTPGAQGPAGLAFGTADKSAMQLVDERMQSVFGDAWTNTPPDIKAEVFDRSQRYAYGLFVDAAQTVSVPTSKAAENYLLKGMSAKDSERSIVDDLHRQLAAETDPGRKQNIVNAIQATRKQGVFPTGATSGGKRVETSAAATFERDLTEGTQVLESPELRRNPHGQVVAGQGITKNPVGQYPVNFGTLMHAITSGMNLDFGDRLVREWYENSAKELLQLFGPDALDKISQFTAVVAATSSQAGPEQNMRAALKVMTVLMGGADTSLAQEAGLTRRQIMNLQQLVSDFAKVARESSEVSVGKTKVRIPATSPSEYPHLGNITEAHTRSSAAAVSGALDIPGTSRQSGVKFADYSHSTQVNAIADQIRHQYQNDPELATELTDALRHASVQYTPDRHEGTLAGWGIEVSPTQQRARRALGWMTSRMVGIPTEAGQAITWYYSKGAKGFSRYAKGDDLSTIMFERMKELGVDAMEPSERRAHLVQSLVKEVLSKGQFVEPGEMRGRRIADVAGFMVDKLRDLQKGTDKYGREFFGGTYRLADPSVYKELPKGGVDELQLVDGYVVALTGTPIMRMDDPGAESAIRTAIDRFAPILGGPNGDALKLGFYKSGDDSFSFDLNLVVPTREEAEQIGRQLNQESIYDVKADDLIPTGGTGEPVLKGAADVENFLTDYLDKPIGADIPQVPSGQELYAMSPEQRLLDTGFQRAVKPLLDAYNNSRLAQTFRSTSEQFGKMKFEKATSYNADQIVQAGKAPYDGILSTEAHRVLNQHSFKEGDFDGMTIGEAYQNTKADITSLQQKLKAANIKWAPEAKLQDKLALLTDKADKDIVRKYDKYRVDLLNADPKEATLSILDHAVDDSYGLKADQLTGYRLLRAAWGEQALASIRYHTSNLWGGWFQNILGGANGGMNPLEFARNIRVAFGQEMSYTDSMNPTKYPTKWMDTLSKWGWTDAPQEVSRTQATAGIVGGDSSTKSAVGKLAAQITHSDKLGKIIGKPFEINKRVAAGTEMLMRGSLWSDAFEEHMARNIPSLNRDLVLAAERSGISLDMLPDEVFKGAPEAVKQALKTAGMKDGQAEHMARMYANVRRGAWDAGIKQIERIQFSYDYTNLDEWISKIVPFHYWATRATRFYLENSVRHPIWLYNYARLAEGMDKLQEDPGMNARSKGFIRMMSGPQGFSLLMNPEALFGVVKTFQLDSNFTPEGETEFGKIIRLGKERGVGLLPWVDATFNYMGAYGDTFAPDPAGIRTRALVGAAVNAINAYSGEAPGPAPYESSNVKLRAFLSSLADSWLPDWMAQPVQPHASKDGTITSATLDDLISTRIMESNPGITNEQMIELLNDPDDPRYQSAYQDVAKAGLLQNVLNFSMPTNFKVRSDARDVDRAAINTIRKGAKEAGADPDAYMPTVGDQEFAALFEQQTGKKFNPGDYQEAQLRRDLASAPPEVQPFVLWDAEYHSLGDSEGRALMDKAQKIRNGEWMPDGLRNVPPEAFGQVADAWIKRNDKSGKYDQIRTMQQAYRNLHPDYDEFKQWQSMMFNIQAYYGENGFALYRSRVSKTNPNAASYFDASARRIKQDHPTWTPEQMMKELDRFTIGPSAWFAITGKSKSQYNAAPLPTNGPDPATMAAAAQQGQPQGGGPNYPTTWSDALQRYAR